VSRDGGWTKLELLLSLMTRMRPGEGRPAGLFFLHAFLLMASYQMVKALREAFMLTKFSAETRSYAVALMALLLMLAVPFYGRLRRHLDGAQLLRVVTIFFAVTLPLFGLLDRFGIPIAFPFYIWVSIYGLMVVSQMWAFAADSFNMRTGQRLFVVIMLGSNVGALAGAQLMNLTVERLSPFGLMLIATGALVATLFLASPERAAVPRGSRAVAHQRRDPPRARALGGIALVLRDPYLLLIAAFVLLLNWINSTGEFILADFVKAHAEGHVAPGGETLRYIAAFYGNFQFWVTLVSLGIQLLLVSRIYRLVGIQGALLVHPIIVVVGYGVLAMAPVLGGFIPLFSLVRRIKVADDGVDYSLMNTTRQTLFLPVDSDSKYEGKMAIDTFFVRLGDLLQALCVFVGLNMLGWMQHQFALLNFVMSLGWMALAVAVGRAFHRRALDKMTSIPPEAVEPIPDLRCIPGEPFQHPISPTAFRERDPGDVLALHAHCENGRRLPGWVRFNAHQQVFHGMLPTKVVFTEMRIVVIASNMDGLSAHSSFAVRRVEAVDAGYPHSR
jgi:ATP:ADP antiporter, AAA family